jgi:hypothetical protein
LENHVLEEAAPSEDVVAPLPEVVDSARVVAPRMPQQLPLNDVEADVSKSEALSAPFLVPEAGEWDDLPNERDLFGSDCEAGGAPLKRRRVYRRFTV